MFKLIKLIIPFITELFVDKKAELDFYSAQFNAVRWIQVIVTVVLIALLVFTGRALLHVSYKYIRLQQDYELLQSQSIVQQSHIDELQATVNRCNDEGAIILHQTK